MTPSRAIRVLIVDDSRTVRAVLVRVLGAGDGLEVAGEAASGHEAVAAVLRIRPDVVLMDVEMPGGDGLEATARIMAECPTPILLFTSHADRHQQRTAFTALQRGAVEILPKPSDTQGWDALRLTLPQLLLQVAGRHRRPDRHPVPAPMSLPRNRPGRVPALVAVGASTGGPAALRELLAALPADGPVAVVVVQHIAPGFEAGLAEWLNASLSWQVRLAGEGEILAPGHVRLAPSGAHLEVCEGLLTRLDPRTEPRSGHRPSADVLFESCARAEPGRTVGVLLSGMGADGASGLLTLRQAGGMTMAQDEASCAVFGMPRAALTTGAATVALPPGELARAIARLWERKPT